MTKREELNLFLEKADEMINSKYILADIKIVNLLKSIASSDTLIALFKNCLADFDYKEAKKKYLIKSPYLAEDKGEFVVPQTSRELLAFVFNVLVDIDGERIDLSEFTDKYFYVDGSGYSAYSSFLEGMIKPFKNTVMVLMEGVIEGRLQDPVEALKEEEEKKAEQESLAIENAKKDQQLAKKGYGEKVKKIKEILLSDKKKVKTSRLKEDKKTELIIVIDMLANVIESTDKDAIIYAFIAYKYVAKSHKILMFNRINKVNKFLQGIINEL